MMSLIPWNHTLSRDFGRLFEGFFGDRMPESCNWTPSVDVAETEKEFTVTGEVPGMDPKEFDVQIKDGVLSLSGEKKDVREEKRDGYHHVERSFGSFHRRFRLPSEVDEKKVTAEYDNGVITIHLPKTKPEEPKRIDVKKK